MAMFTLFFRALILYTVMIVTMRGLGKRQLGQFQPYEFAMTILLADLIATPMESISTPLLYGILPVAALFAVHSLITLLSLKFDGLRAIISGKPSVVISKGIIDQQELKRLCLSISDLLEGLRSVGILDPAEVGTAVIEANGQLTAFPDAHKRCPTTGEMGIDPGYEGLPLTLIMDGSVQKNNLSQTGKSVDWLDGVLTGRGLAAKQVYLASLDTRGKLTVQIKGGGMFEVQAVDPAAVVW
jgi:uncharacterized membrane protein YcaP (DUF421 family)